MKKRVDEFLSASRQTKRLASLSLGRGRQLAVWHNSHDEIQYNATSGHVFSLYLNGGAGTRRVDGSVKSGEPGTLCVLPEGHSSEWQITETFQFVHLYVANDALRAAYAKTHDQDARRLDIAEQTFTAPGVLERPMLKMAQAALDGDVLAADSSFSDMVAGLEDRPVRLVGGLSSRVVRDVNDWIEAHIDGEIRLYDMAKLAGISEYHFHRMFSLTCGMTPHNWVTRIRVELAKKLLKQEPMAGVAVACGFSSQSHFIRRFKEQMGVTPGQYVRMIMP
ncbi:helix-turn-helix transcriptional regulator [Parasedimentitalea maritima]|uniref:Helix-turn-helix transcriptional regulator n=1 Tax=Parasedimentitalea maritima TaxID=2578117 RepID=A0ABY2UUM2_9RHOB|nr:AraC family transcriptional regulator [Zongyanglinia marina]TLP64394.1 helix-turn-helix transcriptional regulator [Zongyanglinia marina]